MANSLDDTGVGRRRNSTKDNPVSSHGELAIMQTRWRCFCIAKVRSHRDRSEHGLLACGASLAYPSAETRFAALVTASANGVHAAKSRSSGISRLRPCWSKSASQSAQARPRIAQLLHSNRAMARAVQRRAQDAANYNRHRSGVLLQDDLPIELKQRSESRVKVDSSCGARTARGSDSKYEFEDVGGWSSR